MEIAFEGTYDPRSLRQAERATRKLLGRSTVDASGGHLAALAVMLVLGPFIAVLAGAPKSILTWIPLGAFAGLLAALNSWGISRAISNAELVDQEIRGVVSDDGLTLKMPARELQARWPAFSDFASTGQHIVIAGSVEGAVALPRRFFSSDEQFAQAAEIVRRNVRRRRGLVRWRRWFRFVSTVAIVFLIFFLWILYRANA